MLNNFATARDIVFVERVLGRAKCALYRGSNLVLHGPKLENQHHFEVTNTKFIVTSKLLMISSTPQSAKVPVD